MKYGPRKSAELGIKAVELRSTGMIWKDVAKELRVSVKWLVRWANKAGYQRNDRRLLVASPANIERARELRASGICWKLVERDAGAHWPTLQKAIAREDRIKNHAAQSTIESILP